MSWAMPAIMGLGLLMDLIGGVTGNQQAAAATEKENKREDQYNSNMARHTLDFMNMLGQPMGVPGQPGLNDPSAFQQAPAPDGMAPDGGTMGAYSANQGGADGLLGPALAAATMQQQQGAGYNPGQMFEQNPQLMAMLQNGAMGGANQMAPQQAQGDPNMDALAMALGGLGQSQGGGYSSNLLGLLQLLGGLSGQQGPQQ